MVGKEILLQLKVDAKTVECLELLDRLLPNVVELVVQPGSHIMNGNINIYRIMVRLKKNQTILYAKTDNLEGLWSCMWVFSQREAENAANEVLRDFGRVTYLKSSESDERYPLDDVPRFSTLDEFRMKVMLRGGEE